ncbi:unnamed protein product [Acanthoscelides obtectus]|uniref:Uncharacterized protein n=1 Tax=Acanthoscelides obtectus TaxID=200917 RepID=A0A9P0P4H1_ACAOB|nr:unnamed protein product [Acanthoscelides obtectus]CAK1629327.1 hypothetical protein AOBTE_LOCUS5682 [Acanthoscelides obtectus]
MSLFAAFAEQACNKDKEEDANQCWLKNSSFQPSFAIPTTSTSDDVIEETPRDNSDTDEKTNNDVSKRKKRKHKQKRESRKKLKLDKDPPKIQDHTDAYVIDLKGYRELLSVDKISRPSAPIYKIAYYLSSCPGISKRKFKRYHKVVIEKKQRFPHFLKTTAFQLAVD